MSFKRYKIFYLSLLITAVIVAAKFILHYFGAEPLRLGSLHSSVVTGTFFVVGFLLSATIVDYKESERIPSEFSSIIENMYEDAKSFHKNYPKFDKDLFRKRLQEVAMAFTEDVRKKRHGTRLKVHALNDSFVEMEKAGVPANFVVKLKQQQAQLDKVLFRVTYIQRITFIPSATILARSIVPLTVGLLVFTEIEPFYGGMAIVAIISFILFYILKLIQVISVPFQQEGKTQDDVSLFLIDKTLNYLKKDKS
ncbi:MAG TPA: hypothetical protein VD947_03670 [Patescibacteria group bacterium]|nr:hypothetical protein [Patescibacteria group bacterium]